MVSFGGYVDGHLWFERTAFRPSQLNVFPWFAESVGKSQSQEPRLHPVQWRFGKVLALLAMDKLDKPHDARAAFKKAVELAPDDQRIKDASILKQYIRK